MSIRFDSDGVENAASHLARRAEVARQLVAAAARLEGELVDQRLVLAVLALADLTGDAAELVALDLGLLGARMTDGARLLSAAEDSMIGEAERREAARRGFGGRAGGLVEG